MSKFICNSLLADFWILGPYLITHISSFSSFCLLHVIQCSVLCYLFHLMWDISCSECLMVKFFILCRMHFFVTLNLTLLVNSFVSTFMKSSKCFILISLIPISKWSEMKKLLDSLYILNIIPNGTILSIHNLVKLIDIL